MLLKQYVAGERVDLLDDLFSVCDHALVPHVTGGRPVDLRTLFKERYVYIVVKSYAEQSSGDGLEKDGDGGDEANTDFLRVVHGSLAHFTITRNLVALGCAECVDTDPGRTFHGGVTPRTCCCGRL